MSRRSIPSEWIRSMLPKKCMNCGSSKGITYHHIVPVEYGGNEVPTNIAVLCTKCHNMVHYGKNGVIDHGALVRSGLERAKARGVKLGRKRKNDVGEILRIIAENSTQFNDINDADYNPKTEHEIMEMIGFKNVQYTKYKHMLMDAICSEEWPYSWQKPAHVFNRPVYDGMVKRLRGDT